MNEKYLNIFRYFMFHFKLFVLKLEKLKYSKSNVLTLDICSFDRTITYHAITILSNIRLYTCTDIFKLKGNGKY